VAGFGSIGVGTGAFGLGAPVSGEAPPNGPAGSRWINPATRDFEVDSTTKQLAQMPPVRQRVLLALITLVGSSSVLPTFGIRLPRKMGDRFEAQCRVAVTAALRQLTEVEQLIEIQRIDVVKGSGGRSLITVSYRNLETDEEEPPVTV